MDVVTPVMTRSREGAWKSFRKNIPFNIVYEDDDLLVVKSLRVLLCIRVMGIIPERW